MVNHMTPDVLACVGQKAVAIAVFSLELGHESGFAE
jgi:hypothetical protein